MRKCEWRWNVSDALELVILDNDNDKSCIIIDLCEHLSQRYVWNVSLRCCVILLTYLLTYIPGLDTCIIYRDDFIKLKHILCYWPLVRGIHRSPANSLHKGQWRRALIFFLICSWTNGWANHQDDCDLRHYRAHYDVTVMYIFVRVALIINQHWFSQCHGIVEKFILESFMWMGPSDLYYRRLWNRIGVMLCKNRHKLTLLEQLGLFHGPWCHIIWNVKHTELQ